MSVAVLLSAFVVFILIIAAVHVVLFELGERLVGPRTMYATPEESARTQRLGGC